MRYLFNASNIVRGAALSATNIVPSEALYRTGGTRQGGGQVRLVGPYTGQQDTTIEVEVRNSTLVGTPRVSAPTFVGVGNGALTGASATAALAAQRFTIALRDLGTDTLTAFTPFQGVNLKARAAGAAGNLITIAIDESGIARAATRYALIEDLRKEVNEYVGDEWNFGAVPLAADGTIPAGAPRISFGDDPQVYRQYKTFKDNRFVYAFSPAPVRDVSAGAVVRSVTGSRTVTITNGTSTDVFMNVTSLYSLLSQIRANTSGLVDVDGPVVNDALPGGMGVTEMSVRTAGYAKSITRDGSSYVKRAEIGLVVGVNAPTERLEIVCKKADVVGAEVWSVSGAVSGTLADAVTDALYESSDYSFRIPKRLSESAAIAAALFYEVNPISRGSGVPYPDIQLFRPTLGKNARDLELTYTYRLRPVPGCNADTVPVTGHPDPECLGVEPEGVPVAILPLQQKRLERIAKWNAEVTARQQSFWTAPAGWAGDVNAAVAQVAEVLTTGLAGLVGGTYEYPAWAPSTNYALGQIRRPTTPNGFRYRVSVAGASGASQPIWNTAVGSTTTDGGVSWENIGKEPLDLFDEILTAVEQDFEIFDSAWFTTAAGVTAWPGASQAVAIGQVVFPTATNGRRYVAVAAGNTGATEPAWPTTTGGTVTDGGVTWRARPRYWDASTAYATVGKPAFIEGQRVWRLKTAGTSGASEPNWRVGDVGEIADGSAVWEATEANQVDINANGITDRYRDRLEAMINHALATAGVSPNFEGAGGSGTGCWQDDPSATHWWVCSDARYLPAFTGKYYHSATLGHDQNGNPVVVSTQEFGFAIQACSHLEGDSITITVRGAGGGRTYQEGDAIVADVVRGQPLALIGGQTGNNTLTWSVIGSVAGPLADYALNKTAVAPYSNGGLSFTITPGGIPFALNDRFELWIEGGQFRWRRDGGAWSSDTQIAPVVALGTDGLSVAFDVGAAPSFVVGDTAVFRADAINGPRKLEQPTDARLEVSAATEIVVDPGITKRVRDIAIARHTIPSGSTITLRRWTGATWQIEATIPWQADDIFYRHSADLDATKFRLDVSAACGIPYLFMGEGLQAEIRTGTPEVGNVRKRIRLPNGLVRRAAGFTAEHEDLTQTSVDALVAGLAHATEFDHGRFVVVPNDEERDAALVEYVEETLELSDVLGFQPRNVAARLIAVRFDVEPA